MASEQRLCPQRPEERPPASLQVPDGELAFATSQQKAAMNVGFVLTDMQCKDFPCKGQKVCWKPKYFGALLAAKSAFTDVL